MPIYYEHDTEYWLRKILQADEKASHYDALADAQRIKRNKIIRAAAADGVRAKHISSVLKIADVAVRKIIWGQDLKRRA